MANRDDMQYDDYEDEQGGREERPRSRAQSDQGRYQSGGQRQEVGKQSAMSSEAGKIAMALAGGYLLGRTRKLKLVLSLGLWYVMQKAGDRPLQMLEERLTGERMQKALGQQGSRLLESGKQLAASAVSSRMDRWTETLQQRTADLSQPRGEESEQEEEEEYAQPRGRREEGAGRPDDRRREGRGRSEDERREGGGRPEDRRQGGESQARERRRRPDDEEGEEEQPRAQSRGERFEEGRRRQPEYSEEGGRRQDRQAARSGEEEGDWEDERSSAARSGGSREYGQRRGRDEAE